MQHRYIEHKHYSSKCEPCPKCGMRSRFMVDEYLNGDTSQNMSIVCGHPGCGFSVYYGTVSGYEPDGGDATMREAVDKWNRRVNMWGKPVGDADHRIV